MVDGEGGRGIAYACLGRRKDAGGCLGRERGIGYASKNKGRGLGDYCTRARVLRVGWMESVCLWRKGPKGGKRA